MKLKEAVAIMDESSHWYVIPKELKPEWDRLESEIDNRDYIDCPDLYDEFIEKFDEFRTGGALNNTQLYANFE